MGTLRFKGAIGSRLLAAAVLLPVSALALGVDELSKRELVGSWASPQVSDTGDVTESGIRFYPDGTYQVTQGAFQFIHGCGLDCAGVMGTWKIVEGGLVAISRDGYIPGTSNAWFVRGFTVVDYGFKRLVVSSFGQVTHHLLIKKSDR